jgi:hypothetical protein
MMEKELNFADIARKSTIDTGTVSLKNGGRVHYVVTPENKNSFAVLNIIEKKGKTNVAHVVTRDEVADLGSERVALSDFPSYSNAFHTRGKEVKSKKIRTGAEPEPPKPEDKSVQTKEEAKIASDKDLIKQIQEMYKEDSTCLGIDVSKYNSLNAIANMPILARSYFCVGNRHLLYDQTIWSEKYITVIGTEYVETEVYKKFMYENVQKSSKMSLDLGLNLSGMTPVGAAYGPAMGDPVFSNGQPKKDADGSQLKFNFQYMKTWSKLKIEAEMKLKERVQGLKVVQFPR